MNIHLSWGVGSEGGRRWGGEGLVVNPFMLFFCCCVYPLATYRFVTNSMLFFSSSIFLLYCLLCIHLSLHCISSFFLVLFGIFLIYFFLTVFVRSCFRIFFSNQFVIFFSCGGEIVVEDSLFNISVLLLLFSRSLAPPFFNIFSRPVLGRAVESGLGKASMRLISNPMTRHPHLSRKLFSCSSVVECMLTPVL